MRIGGGAANDVLARRKSLASSHKLKWNRYTDLGVLSMSFYTHTKQARQCKYGDYVKPIHKFSFVEVSRSIYVENCPLMTLFQQCV
jgi:hypothetical protein